MIPLSRIPCAEFLRNCKPKPCRFSPAIPFSESAREYVMIFSQFVRKCSTSVATSGIVNEYLYIAHALGGTSGKLTQYFHHGPCLNFGGKLSSLRPNTIFLDGKGRAPRCESLRPVSRPAQHEHSLFAGLSDRINFLFCFGRGLLST